MKTPAEKSIIKYFQDQGHTVRPAAKDQTGEELAEILIGGGKHVSAFGSNFVITK